MAMTAGGFAARMAGDSKAEQLMAQARAALGGEKNLNKVQGLTATGTYQRTMQRSSVAGEVTIDLQLPDKFLRTESLNPIGDMPAHHRARTEWRQAAAASADAERAARAR